MQGNHAGPYSKRGFFVATANSAGRVSMAAYMLMVIAVLVLGGGAAGAQTVPGVIVTQVNWLSTLTAGQPYTVADTAGSSFAVNSNGDILMANASGGQVLLINGRTGVQTVLGTYGSSSTAGGVAVDSQNNLYVSSLYQPYIAKIPYNNGAYAPVTPYVSGTTPTCANNGTDTVECLWLSNLTSGGSAVTGGTFGVVSMAFDAQGDFFWATEAGSPDNPYSILECSASCIANAGTPALLYTEPAPTTSTISGCSGKTVQMYVGGLAADPWGNVFFTDSAIDSCASHQSDSSYLKELVNNGGTYSSPVTLYSYTPTTIGGSDYELDGVAVDGKGTVYFTVLGGSSNGGIFGIPNSQTGADKNAIYSVSPAGIGSYLLTADASGNLYAVSYSKAINTSGADTFARIAINELALPASAVGTSASPNATTAPVYVIDNDSTTPTVTAAVAENDVSSTEFTVTIGSCHVPTLTVPNSSYCSVTLSYTPTTVGERSAVATFSDGTSSAAATAYGVGQGAQVTLDPGVQTAYTSGLTSPAGIAVDNNGDIYVADKGAGKIFNVASGTTVATGLSSPQGVALDANANLYIADTGNNQILEIPNGGSQSALISSTTTFDGEALSAPAGLAVGPNGVLYITDSGHNRVVTWGNGRPGVYVSGLNNPQAVAVDDTGNVYVANEGGGDVLVYKGGGVAASMLTPSGVTQPDGVAVDASGSVLIADAASGNLVRVPNLAGVLTASSALTIATNPKSATGLAIDLSGNLFTSDGAGAAAYKIQRTAASVDLGSVYDGVTSAAVMINAENAGNQALTVNAPTDPTSRIFALGVGTPTDCTTTTSLTVGNACQLSATFSPTLGTVAGTLTTTAAFNSNAVNNTAAPITLRGTVESGASQTITFNPPASVNYSAGNLALTATASSGLTVTFSVVSGPGSISGNTLTITGIGTIVVAADQTGGLRGGVNYDAAPEVTASILVNPIGTTATPTISPVGGTYSAAQTVTISDTTPGATIYYTANNTTPTTSSTVYSAPISVSASNQTIEAIAVAPGYTNSAVATAAYTIQLPAAATPTFTPVAGTYNGTQTVTIGDATAGATIYYTTDNTTPTTSSAVYSAPLTVSSSETIKAIATASGYTTSAVASATYTLGVPGFTMALSTNTLTTSPGGQVYATITITPENGFNSTITISCSGLPLGAVCTFNPVTVKPSGSTVTTQLAVTAGALTADARDLRAPFHPQGGGGAVSGALLACVIGGFLGFRRRRNLWMLVLAVVCSLAGMGVLSGCGGTSSKTSTTTVTVSAVSGSITQSTTFTLVIQ